MRHRFCTGMIDDVRCALCLLVRSHKTYTFSCQYTKSPSLWTHFWFPDPSLSVCICEVLPHTQDGDITRMAMVTAVLPWMNGENITNEQSYHNLITKMTVSTLHTPNKDPAILEHASQQSHRMCLCLLEFHIFPTVESGWENACTTTKPLSSWTVVTSCFPPETQHINGIRAFALIFHSKSTERTDVFFQVNIIKNQTKPKYFYLQTKRWTFIYVFNRFYVMASIGMNSSLVSQCLLRQSNESSGMWVYVHCRIKYKNKMQKKKKNGGGGIWMTNWCTNINRLNKLKSKCICIRLIH